MATPLNSYARRVLALFAEAYPGSAQFRGGRKLRKGAWGKLFPEIKTDVEAKEQFLGGVEALTVRGIVSVKWKRFREGDDVEALYLEDPEMLYSIAGVKRPEQVREEMIAVLESWRPVNEAGAAVKEVTGSKLAVFHPLPVKDADELSDICALLDLSPRETARCSIRALSVILYRNSKRLESVIKPADMLCREALGEAVSSLLGLERKFPEVSFALTAELAFRDGTVWELGGRPLSLPLVTLARAAELRFPEVSASGTDGSVPSVLSIENKESFFVAAGVLTGARQGPFTGYLYTGGYPGEGEARLIALVRSAGGRVYHFGDLDPEGLRIFEAVDRCCEGTALPFLMDRETYLAYARYGYTLDQNNLRRLDGITNPLLGEVKEEMTRTKAGVEQEVIPLTERLGPR